MGPADRNVLIVEDDADIREALTQILEDEGYGVTSAANGLDAMGLLRTRPKPCVILLDLMMPVMNGWQFRSEQQRDSALAGIPVVIISADNAARRDTVAAGVQGFLQKPIELDDLLSVVARFC
jgi:CheY-like chemotaxis protein